MYIDLTIFARFPWPGAVLMTNASGTCIVAKGLRTIPDGNRVTPVFLQFI